jgi:hypothetical protein
MSRSLSSLRERNCARRAGAHSRDPLAHPAYARSRQTPVAGTQARIYSSLREHHMTNILTFFSTRTLLQIIFILGSAVAMKAWSLGLLFGG